MTEPLSYKLKDVPAITGIAYTRIVAAADSGELPTFYPSPKRRCVTREALTAWLASLPSERATG